MKASEYLENISGRLRMFINPVNLQNLEIFFSGFNCGYALAEENLQFHDIVNAWIEVIRSRGWKVNSFGPEREMKEKGMSESEIIEEFVQIQIEVWKFLELKFLKDEKAL